MKLDSGASQTVKELLAAKKPGVQTIRPDATVFEALQMMDQFRVGALPVVKDGQLVGICSERDYARKVALEGRTSKSTPVEDIMTRNVIYVGLNQTADECMALMTYKRIRHLPVLDGGKLVGIISIGDVVRASIAQKDFLIEQLEKFISGHY